MSRIARVLNIPIIDDNLVYKYRLLNLFLFFLCGGVLPNLFVLFFVVAFFCLFVLGRGPSTLYKWFSQWKRKKKMKKTTMTMTQSKKVSSRFDAKMFITLFQRLYMPQLPSCLLSRRLEKIITLVFTESQGLSSRLASYGDSKNKLKQLKSSNASFWCGENRSRGEPTCKLNPNIASSPGHIGEGGSVIPSIKRFEKSDQYVYSLIFLSLEVCLYLCSKLSK